jgi:hypothetical protein
MEIDDIYFFSCYNFLGLFIKGKIMANPIRFFNSFNPQLGPLLQETSINALSPELIKQVFSYMDDRASVSLVQYSWHSISVVQMCTEIKEFVNSLKDAVETQLKIDESLRTRITRGLGSLARKKFKLPSNFIEFKSFIINLETEILLLLCNEGSYQDFKVLYEAMKGMKKPQVFRTILDFKQPSPIFIERLKKHFTNQPKPDDKSQDFKIEQFIIKDRFKKESKLGVLSSFLNQFEKEAGSGSAFLFRELFVFSQDSRIRKAALFQQSKRPKSETTYDTTKLPERVDEEKLTENLRALSSQHLEDYEITIKRLVAFNSKIRTEEVLEVIKYLQSHSDQVELPIFILARYVMGLDESQARELVYSIKGINNFVSE